ncbi:MAG TPA: hypothetical protein VHA10_07955 [Hypericibacter adhaerens]|jgi:hypothetical protein|uniref:Sulfur globule protein CV1 n=1 Tax=Hypericibacter adhaerens TaxID=2602016 RepID=A0A5J6N1Q4_9PROT|nr:hypothetical protein [Hypericibacter adhaerens]QEX22885.1 hypothetical protein FRZ61_28190 [Hypericibacter adhaerens]HWA43129.1 hypothetical protein [Hypericibacter adhaerens]
MKTLTQAPAPNGWADRRTAFWRLALALATVLAVLAMAGPSRADNDDWNNGWKHHNQGWDHNGGNNGWGNKGWGGYGKHYPGYVYAPPPRYYYPPPPRYVYAPPPPRYYYPPPPVIYAPPPPPPVYYYPQPSFNVVIPLRID